MNATSASPAKTKNVSIIQSAITQLDWSFSGCIVRERGAGRDERDDRDDASDEAGGVSLLARHGRRDRLLRCGGQLVAARAGVVPGPVEQVLVDRLDAGGRVLSARAASCRR